MRPRDHLRPQITFTKSGVSTSPKKEGTVCRQKIVVKRGTVPQAMASITDHKFTMLSFMSALGEVVCCAVIFQSKSQAAPETWHMGIGYSITPILSANGEEIDIEMNIRNGKYYPGGPTCQSMIKQLTALPLCRRVVASLATSLLQFLPILIPWNCSLILPKVQHHV